MGTLEVCIDSASAISVCVDGGADSIELCSALALGGLTPSAGFMQLAAQNPVPVHSMIRPRTGNFCFNGKEIEVMCDDIAVAANTGMSGVVLGIANQDGTLNIEALALLCEAAGTMGKTLHRVIDTLADPLLGLKQAIDLGFDRVLTSGGKANVADGVDLLAKLQSHAGDQIQIMAGAGLTPALVSQIYHNTGIESFHASCRRIQPVDQQLMEMGFASAEFSETDIFLVRRFRDTLNQA